jgi:3-hydroxyacyl-CoA dehydrogenase
LTYKELNYLTIVKFSEEMKMTLDRRLENVAVIGAAGKMGSGIVLLIAQEMVKLKLKNPDRGYHLYAIDVSEEMLDGLSGYMRAQATKAAEKSCVMLRGLYKDRKDLIENFDIIEQYSNDVMDVIRPCTELSMARKAHMVFEAIVEDKNVKINILNKLNDMCSTETFYFTNTSSIPIHILDEGVGLDGRIIGFHFYNPPAVQKLAELIPAETTQKELLDISQEIGTRLRKKIILSNDVAGFIGNGHFMRDILHAVKEVQRLSDTFSYVEAAYAINRVSQEFLIRPMGIFQLVDYVGIEVCQLIMSVMSTHIQGFTLKCDLIDRMVDKKVIGGQYADGSQKDGILKYEKNRVKGIYDIESGEYVMFDTDGWTKKVDDKLGDLPENWSPWRKLLMDPQKEQKLRSIFNKLKLMETLGADLAKTYLKRSKAIGEGLVTDGVARSVDDVNGVLINGFYHLYGPVNDLIM